MSGKLTHRITATLTTDDSILSVIDGVVNIGAMTTLQSVTEDSAFRIAVSGSVTNDHRVSFMRPGSRSAQARASDWSPA